MDNNAFATPHGPVGVLIRSNTANACASFMGNVVALFIE